MLRFKTKKVNKGALLTVTPFIELPRREWIYNKKTSLLTVL